MPAQRMHDDRPDTELDETPPAYEPEPIATTAFASDADDPDGVDPSPAWSTDPELAD
jgi:hypothetical protein